jgi:serine/threonine protein kinase
MARLPPARCPEIFAEESDPGLAFEEILFDEPIGTGSFGAVWKGRCRGDVVAVKACKVGDAHDSDMLLREIRYLQKLRHPRLVSFLGFCNRPPHIHLLMEFMPGGSLHALLFNSSARGRRLSFERKARMAHQVADGLAYLHEQHVVHRDLKTMNIVLDLALSCKICDFGLTITLEKTHLTVRHIQGSPRYMAPEQFEAAARITEKVDIWQMGCVMLELFCNAVPFAAAGGVQQIATELLVKRRPPPCPSEADPRARVLVQSCLRIDARRRPWAGMLEEALSIVVSSFADAQR